MDLRNTLATGYERYDSDPDGLFNNDESTSRESRTDSDQDGLFNDDDDDDGESGIEDNLHLPNQDEEDNHYEDRPPLLKLDPLAFTHVMCFLHEFDVFNLEIASYTANKIIIEN